MEMMVEHQPDHQRDQRHAPVTEHSPAKPSRIVNLLDSVSECAYGLFFCGYRSLFVDSYQFEDFVFYSLWMLCLHFCVTDQKPNVVRHYA